MWAEPEERPIHGHTKQHRRQMVSANFGVEPEQLGDGRISSNSFFDDFSTIFRPLIHFGAGALADTEDTVSQTLVGNVTAKAAHFLGRRQFFEEGFDPREDVVNFWH